jgi:hypothetical protein
MALEVLPMPTSHSPPPGKPRIVVIGPCASGKSTLVSGLRDHGYDALASGQEHSDIHHLWNRTNPDVVIALEISLEAIRQRRDDPSWPAWLFDRQLVRLRQAIAAADLVIDTTRADAAQVLSQSLAFLARSRTAA